MRSVSNWVYIIATPIIGIGLLSFKDYLWAVVAFAACAILLTSEISKMRRRDAAVQQAQPPQVQTPQAQAPQAQPQQPRDQRASDNAPAGTTRDS
ncbi:MAG: hypothetical protein J2P25_13885 [Nocardiopsaceae bacterium]|nr:hypothetical protein [Nocardiopsaceae bacterium]